MTWPLFACGLVLPNSLFGLQLIWLDSHQEVCGGYIQIMKMTLSQVLYVVPVASKLVCRQALQIGQGEAYERLKAYYGHIGLPQCARLNHKCIYDRWEQVLIFLFFFSNFTKTKYILFTGKSSLDLVSFCVAVYWLAHCLKKVITVVPVLKAIAGQPKAPSPQDLFRQERKKQNKRKEKTLLLCLPLTFISNCTQYSQRSLHRKTTHHTSAVGKHATPKSQNPI